MQANTLGIVCGLKLLLCGSDTQVSAQRLIRHPVEGCSSMLCGLLAGVMCDITAGWYGEDVTLGPPHLAKLCVTVPISPAASMMLLEPC